MGYGLRHGVYDFKKESGPSYPTTDLIALWKFEDDLVDSINGYNGTVIVGSIAYATGKIGKCGDFNGDRIRTALPKSYTQNTAPFSLSWWVKTTTTTASRYFSTYSGTWPQSWWFGIQGDGKLSNLRGGTEVNTASAYNDGNWHHCVGVYDGTTTQKLYIDGDYSTSKATVTGEGSVGTSNDYLIIGKELTTNAFTGQIDQVYFYSRVLTEAEMLQLWNSGAGV